MPGVRTSLKYGDSILDIIVLVEILKFWAPQSITTQIRLIRKWCVSKKVT